MERVLEGRAALAASRAHDAHRPRPAQLGVETLDGAHLVGVRGRVGVRVRVRIRVRVGVEVGVRVGVRVGVGVGLRVGVGVKAGRRPPRRPARAAGAPN